MHRFLSADSIGSDDALVVACKVPRDVADLEIDTMKRPPFMFAAIVVVIFVIFLLAIVLWTGVFPGPHLTSNPRVQP
jgi:hypothetical protein